MSAKQMFILFLLSASLLLVGGVSQVYLLFQKSEGQAVFLLLPLALALIILGKVIFSLYKEMKQGIPFNDERSKKLKLFAAGHAYFYSLFLWIALFAFKKYFQTDDLLLIGLGGMVFLLALSWLKTQKQSGNME
ncbi:MAG: hypothetical protein WAM07_04175 [Halobacillus sp.]|uniref:hypothetical protein n=1 Tax=Halobacillus sp. TaxID=56800 RepID=UPI003BAE8DD1